MAAKSSTTSSTLKSLESTLESYLVKKAPALPKPWKEFIVKILPWLIIIFLILTIPALLAALGVGALFLPFSFMPIVGSIGLLFVVGVVISLLASFLELIALPGLFKQSLSSWKLLFYAALIGAIVNVITFNLVGLVVGTLLSLYILFQIREYYK